MEQTSSAAYPNILVVDYVKKARVASPQLLAKAGQFLHVGYQRLLTFECRGGGFEWYGRAPAVVWLSAYGLQEFSDMARVMDIDKAVITRTQDWLMKQRDRDGTWSNMGGSRGNAIAGVGDPRLLLTSYVVWSLVESGLKDPQLESSIQYLRNHLEDIRDNAYVLALTANALAAWDPKDDSTLKALQWLYELRQEKPEWKACSFPAPGRQSLTYARGDSITIETTALAVLAMLKAAQYPQTVDQALTYLLKSKGPNGTWGSTSATILSLKALVAGTGAQVPGKSGAFTILVNGKEAGTGKVDDFNADVLQLFDLKALTRTGANEIAIRPTGDVQMMYQIVGRHFEPWQGQAPPAEPALDLKVAYDRTELTTADKLHAVATLRYRGQTPTYMVIVDLGIPPGFAPDPAEFDKMVEQKKIDKYTLTARQITLYLGDVRPGDNLTFSYTLQPRYPLKAKSPPTVAYEYYTPANRAEARPVELTVRER